MKYKVQITCHGSWNVVTCTKLWSDYVKRMINTAILTRFPLWDYKMFMKWTPACTKANSRTGWVSPQWPIISTTVHSNCFHISSQIGLFTGAWILTPWDYLLLWTILLSVWRSMGSLMADSTVGIRAMFNPYCAEFISTHWGRVMH